MTHPYAKATIREIYPIRLDLAPSLRLYAIWGTDKYDQDFLVKRGRKIVLFRTFRGMRSFAAAHFPGLVLEPGCTPFRISSCRKAIERQKQQTAEAIDTFNLFFDMLKTLGVPIPEQDALYRFADYATFHHDLAPFFEENPEITAERLLRFVDWCTGVWLNHAIISDPAPQVPDFQKVEKS